MIGRFLTRRSGRRSLWSRRPAFTLVELLVSVTIIGIMASTVLFALYGVMEDARTKRTQAQIQKLNELLMRRWESYRTRPVPLEIPLNKMPTNTRRVARARLKALRDLIRLELPDRRTDVQFGPVPIALRDDSNNLISPAPKINRPSVSQAYFRRVATVWNNGKWFNIQPHTPTSGPPQTWTPDHQGAECLYMIVSAMRDGDGSALDFFLPGEIGDVDNDRMPEILDAWGNPIEFLRWAPGFRSDGAIPSPSIQKGDATEAPDPFDMLKVDAAWFDNDTTNDPFALYPLVFSAGPDGLYEIVTDETFPDPPNPDRRFRYTSDSNPKNNPYYKTGGGEQFGQPFKNASGYLDNITNHALDL